MVDSCAGHLDDAGVRCCKCIANYYRLAIALITNVHVDKKDCSFVIQVYGVLAAGDSISEYVPTRESVPH